MLNLYLNKSNIIKLQLQSGRGAANLANVDKIVVKIDDVEIDSSSEENVTYEYITWLDYLPKINEPNLFLKLGRHPDLVGYEGYRELRITVFDSANVNGLVWIDQHPITLITELDQIPIYNSDGTLYKDEKVAVIDGGEAGYLWGTDGTDGVIRVASPLTITKSETNDYITIGAEQNPNNFDEKVKVSVEGTAGYLVDKVLAGDNIEIGNSLNEQLLISLNESPTVSAITFNPSGTYSPAPYQLYPNVDDGTLDLTMNGSGVVQQIGLETLYRVKATQNITNGQVVMAVGAQGASGRILAAPAQNVTNPQLIMGIATQEISVNELGYVTHFGMVRGVDTTGGAENWQEGDLLYYNPYVIGGLTKIVPHAPNAKATIAIVVRVGSGGSGVLAVRVRVGSSFGVSDNNVEFSTLENNDLVVYNQTNSRWENKKIEDVPYVLPTTASPINNNELVFQLDNDTTLTIKVKGSDGIIRSTSLTLS